MAGAADKDASALAALYLLKRAQLLRFFTLRTHSAAEAEDVVQEIYIRIATLDAKKIENPAAYLYRLGTNIMLDRMRTRRRAAARDGAYVKANSAVAGGETPADDAPSPEAVWQSRAQLQRVLEVVERMPSRRKQAFVLHKIDGLSYAEVAERLSISVSAVEKLMMAALRDLMSGGA